MKQRSGTPALLRRGLILYYLALATAFLSLDMRFALAHSGTNHLSELEGIATDFALALLNRDPGTLRPHLHPRFTAPGGSMSGSRRLDANQFLDEVVSRAESDLRVDLSRLQTKPDGVGVRLGPIMIGVGSGEIAHIPAILHMVPVENQWLIRRISYDSALADEMRRDDASEYLKLQEVAFRVVGPDGEHIPALRVSIEDEDGRYWPPLGRRERVPLGWGEDVGGDVVIGGRTYAYVRDRFRALLPGGRYSLHAERGMEWEPARIDFEVAADRRSSIEISLKRWINMRAEGWISADTHVHFLDPQLALLEAQGEDLNIVNLLATKWGHRTTGFEHFTGAPSKLSSSRHLVYVNQESRHGFLGHTILLGLKTPVPPFAWGGPGEGVPGGYDFPPMSLVARQAMDQGALVSWAHLPLHVGELAIDTALGCIAAVDLLTWGDAFSPLGNRPGAAELWYQLLSAGYRIPALAGTDKMLNTQVVGSVRSYARLEGDPSYTAWLQAIEAGRTQVTTGPVLSLEVNDAGIGEVVSLESPSTVTAIATLRSRQPVDRLEIIVGGEVHASLEVTNDEESRVLQTDIPIDKPTWIAARAWSETLLPFQMWTDLTPEGIKVMAHTSPVYVELAAMKLARVEALRGMIESAERALAWAETEANYHNGQERMKVEEVFREAISRLQARRDTSRAMDESIPADWDAELATQREYCPKPELRGPGVVGAGHAPPASDERRRD